MCVFLTVKDALNPCEKQRHLDFENGAGNADRALSSTLLKGQLAVK